MNEQKLYIDTGLSDVIKWIPVDPGSGSVFNVDFVFPKYIKFWQGLEFYCVAECCGINAYRFHPEDIVEAATEVDSAALKTDLLKLKAAVSERNEECIESAQLNHYLNREVFLKLIDHIIVNL